MKRLTLFSVLAAALALSACANQTKTMTCQKPASGYYCVQPGDTLYRISQRFGVPLSDLQQWNQLQGSQINSGQILQVSASARKRSAATRAEQMQQAQPQTQAAAGQVQKLQLPVNGFLIRNYDSNNFGIDIAAQRGMPVKAAADGVVIYAGEEVRGYGKLLLVRHSNTLLTAYGNNDTFLVPSGARVMTGQPIATVGNSGRADGQNALHFEVRINGKAVNPEPFFH